MVRRITYNDYYDKVLGGWIGKFIGGAIGGPVEGDKAIHQFEYYTSIPSNIASDNDDTDFQIVWLYLLKEKGTHIRSHDLIDAWLKHITFPFSEYGYAMKNFKRGIKSPVSGWFNNDFFKESMGCPIRSEIWGFIFPGNPQMAAHYAKQDGELDHAGNSVWAEMFLAAIDAAAFLEKDIGRLLQIGLRQIPGESRLAYLIRDVIDWCKNEKDWRLVRRFILNKYGHPDMTSVLQNLGIIILALIYGNGDFEKTILIAANSGYDSDCTCASVGAIMGVILGAKNIPSKWKDPIGNNFMISMGVVNLEYDNRISVLAEETCCLGIEAGIELNKKTKIREIPSRIKVRSRLKSTMPINLEIDYCGMPSISYEGKKEIALIVKNESLNRLKGTLQLHFPRGWIISPSSYKVTLTKGKSGRFIFHIEIPKSVPAIASGNKFTAILSSNGKELVKEHFGLSGTNIWFVLGPFWKDIEHSNIKTYRYPEHIGRNGPLPLPPLHCMLNNDAGTDEIYLPEPDIGKDTLPDSKLGVLFERKIIYAHEDRLDLDTVFTMQGPATIYLVQYLNCPDERDAWFVIGMNDAIKFWLNGELMLSSHEHSFCTPSNQSCEGVLRKGLNKILVKLSRCGDSFRFRFGIKEHHKQHFHQEHWMLDVESIPPWLIKDRDA